MPSDARGTITALEALLPGFQHISSSTDASPIVVTTSTPHGMLSGDTVMIDGHLVNTNANGASEVVVLSATTFQLVGSTGNGVGGATGTSRYTGFGSVFQIPAVGDARDVGAISAAFEACADRDALLIYLLNFDQHTYAGGAQTVHEDGKVVFNSGAVLFGVSGSSIEGSFNLGDGTNPNQGAIDVTQFSRISFQSGSVLDVQHGASVGILGDIAISGAATFELGIEMEVQSTGSIVLDSSAHLDVHGGAAINFTGSTSQITGTCLLNSWNAAAGSSLTFNGSGAANALVLNNTAVALNASSTVADAASTTKSGPTVMSGTLGYVGGRGRYITSHANGTETINTWEQEIVTTGTTQTGNVTIILNNPPNNERITVTFQVYDSRLNGNNLIVHDQSGNLINTYTPGQDSWTDYRWDAAAGTYIILRLGPLVP